MNKIFDSWSSCPFTLRAPLASKFSILKTFRFSLVAGILLTLAACAVPKKPSKLSFLKDSWDGQTSANYIEMNVSRASSAYEPIQVKATLYTRAYLEALEMENGVKRLKPAVELKKELDRQIQSYVSKSTCFNVTINGKDSESASFKSYTAYIRDSAMDPTPVEFLASFDSLSNPQAVTGSAGTTYTKTGVACTTKRSIDLTKPFVFYMTDNISKKVALAWEAPLVQ